jgi:hypothetical protein
MAQTSVEWLVSHLNKQEWFTHKQKEFIEQAKKMHEAESKNAYKKGWKDGWKDGNFFFNSEQRKKK